MNILQSFQKPARKRDWSDWNRIDPRSFWGQASMQTLETHVLRKISAGLCGEPPEVTSRASAILADRHTIRPAPADSALSPYERTLKTTKTGTSPA